MDTCIIQTPLYYKQLVWSQKCQKSYVPYLYNTDTSVKWTLGSVPLVSVLKRFDCSSFLFWSLCETVPDKGKPWFMYEAYQHIIKVQVEYLIRIGVDPALKVKNSILYPKCCYIYMYSWKMFARSFVVTNVSPCGVTTVRAFISFFYSKT